LEHLKIVALNS